MFLAFLLFLFGRVQCQCDDNGQLHPIGDKWIRNGNFLVTCADGSIKILKCITDAGTMIDVGTKKFVEDEIEYACLPNHNKESGKDEVNVNKCGDFADASDDLYKGNFVVCCISRRFKGCRDKNSDIIKSGFFVAENNALKYCKVAKNQLSARIEPKGCFNGSSEDPVEDSAFHVDKYSKWIQGDHEFRCGDDGIQIYRCLPKGQKPVFFDSAWIDKKGVVQLCGRS